MQWIIKFYCSYEIQLIIFKSHNLQKQTENICDENCHKVIDCN